MKKEIELTYKINGQAIRSKTLTKQELMTAIQAIFYAETRDPNRQRTKKLRDVRYTFNNLLNVV